MAQLWLEHPIKTQLTPMDVEAMQAVSTMYAEPHHIPFYPRSPYGMGGFRTQEDGCPVGKVAAGAFCMTPCGMDNPFRSPQDNARWAHQLAVLPPAGTHWQNATGASNTDGYNCVCESGYEMHVDPVDGGRYCYPSGTAPATPAPQGGATSNPPSAPQAPPPSQPGNLPVPPAGSVNVFADALGAGNPPPQQQQTPPNSGGSDNTVLYVALAVGALFLFAKGGL